MIRSVFFGRAWETTARGVFVSSWQFYRFFKENLTGATVDGRLNWPKVVKNNFILDAFQLR